MCFISSSARPAAACRLLDPRVQRDPLTALCGIAFAAWPAALTICGGRPAGPAGRAQHVPCAPRGRARKPGVHLVWPQAAAPRPSSAGGSERRSGTPRAPCATADWAPLARGTAPHPPRLHALLAAALLKLGSLAPFLLTGDQGTAKRVWPHLGRWL
ncbi:MAG: hypothetical protein J3K34DRAFT_445696 [Monoraphidium minutum]|nr:MAG: hypothetical protein J3K34DRAFT_445696 [Monoraphidium minutum]